MGRRQYGTGSVYRRADGRWMGVLQAGWTARGTRRTVSVSAPCPCPGECAGEGKCRGWREARTRLNKKRRELTEHGPTRAATGRATVKSWADEWLPMHEREVRPKTYTTDAGAVRRWIVPTIGTKRLATLTPGDVRSVHAAIIDAGRSTTTARQAHWTLMGMLKAARAEGHPVPVAATEVTAPTKATNDRDAIPLMDAVALRNHARTRPDAARWVLAMHYGMRQGEVLGLTWAALDLTVDHGPLTIEWQLQQLPYADRAAGTFRVPDGYDARHLTGSYHLVRPKSRTGYRVVPILPELRAHLLEWREQHATGNPWDLVFTGADTRNGRSRVLPRRAVVDRQDWIDMQDAAGIRHPSGRHYVLHEARHTAATLLMAEGVSADIISAILGHTVQTSKIYKHVSTALAADALARAGRALDR